MTPTSRSQRREQINTRLKSTQKKKEGNARHRKSSKQIKVCCSKRLLSFVMPIELTTRRSHPLTIRCTLYEGNLPSAAHTAKGAFFHLLVSSCWSIEKSSIDYDNLDTDRKEIRDALLDMGCIIREVGSTLLALIYSCSKTSRTVGDVSNYSGRVSRNLQLPRTRRIGPLLVLVVAVCQSMVHASLFVSLRPHTFSYTINQPVSKKKIPYLLLANGKRQPFSFTLSRYSSKASQTPHRLGVSLIGHPNRAIISHYGERGNRTVNSPGAETAFPAHC